MNEPPVRCVRRAGLLLLAALAPLVCSCVTLAPLDEDACEGDCKWQARVCEKPSVMALARDVDELEEHLDKYGSVVAKQPDVWGQARMQLHREQVEKVLADRLGKFTETLQGSLSRSDQAYFADAFALSAAISGQQAGLLPPGRVVVNNNTGAANTVQPTALPPPPATVQTEVFEGFGKITRSDVPKPLLPSFAQTTISLEPTEFLDQLNRYLGHLDELRRINEGDDTADSPGYSLNLVRIPVSVLPGKKTRVGYGAEVTMTLTPCLSDELLPTTFRNLVVNDLVDQLGLPITQALNDCEVRCVLRRLHDDRYPPDECSVAPKCSRCAAEAPRMPKAVDPPPGSPADGGEGRAKAYVQSLKENPSRVVNSVIRHHYAIPATKTRRARLPFPPSQMEEVYGSEFLMYGALEAYETFRNDLSAEPVVHFPDVQGYLQEELAAAYRLLADPHNAFLWDFCKPELATMVHTHQAVQLAELRRQFVDAVSRVGDVDPRRQTPVALAWAIVVESALLNEQLIRDMRESAASKGCPCPPGEWLPYYLPDPPPEARRAFNDYVRCRWPIHVFALDPVTQEQNIADQFSRRRETQLALSLAFVSGQINANNMTRYARRLEADMETIDLNRTAVGFSHGEDTFGWRFYPRFQTPDVEGNAVVLFRDLLIGGPNRDADLSQRRLEPGARECLAVVIMPSFVPYASLDVSANWFKLTNPKCKELTAAESMRLGRAVKAIQTCGPNVDDADCYRDGDVARLLDKARKLEARLPFQSATVQVPYENTLGGFAMFNTGVTDLAPELTGWYGTPVIDPARNTTLFLVGNHFSVLGTRVVAGGVDVPRDDVELLSRQVMKVTIPKGAIPIPDNGHYPTSVDVHLATPYGVTSHLLIPTPEGFCQPPPPPKEEIGLKWGGDARVELAFIYSGLGIAVPGPPDTRPKDLTVTVGDPAFQNTPATLTLALPSPFGGPDVKLATPVDFKGGVGKVKGEDLTALVTRLQTTFGPEATNPPCPFVVDTVTLEPTDPTKGPAKKLSTLLTVSWVLAPR
jgi:hypothetical protein